MLRDAGITPVYANGVRISDDNAMRVVQQACGCAVCALPRGCSRSHSSAQVCGYARSRVEGALARGRSSNALGRMASGGVGVDVVGGNLFYTAQPVGVRSGIDYMHTGGVRRIEVDKMRLHLDAGQIVLMTALGYSASGEVFNVRTDEVRAPRCGPRYAPAEIRAEVRATRCGPRSPPRTQVAARTAGSLRASKLIFISPASFVACTGPKGCRPSPPSNSATVAADGWQLVQSMRLTEAKGLIRYYGETEDLYSDENMAAAPADAPPTPVGGRAQARVWRLLLPLVLLSPPSLIVESAALCDR